MLANIMNNSFINIITFLDGCTIRLKFYHILQPELHLPWIIMFYAKLLNKVFVSRISFFYLGIIYKNT